ncbi:hypothetical protein BVC80_849g1 [Macleaya cordata]|uniref:Endonuclease/exonuclease/phosphatase n=1 Tax=Macleaya cordata TaxID=56857 RepID=A0A200Q0U8_MACCD|nr:hypothetical protein BVC80_849g1 [Macleaya cordata]
MESQYTGFKYSWSNNQVGHKRILCKLDRTLFNNLWQDTYGSWSYKVLTRDKSDHAPLIGYVKSIPKPSNAPFRFQNMRISHNSFLDVVSQSWQDYISGNPALRFAYKLKRLKDKLKWWNSNVFGDINSKLKDMEEEVTVAMKVSDEDPTDLNKLSQLLLSQRNLNNISQQYETFLNKKARVRWIKEGARNSKYLHTSIKFKQSCNQIVEIIDEEDRGWTSQQDIKNVLQTMVTSFAL